MALIKCSECSKEISDKAETCVHCGCPLSATLEKAYKLTKCPECGHPMEFFKDDATRRCGNCKKKIVNPKMDFGCDAYCQYAEQCIGTDPERCKTCAPPPSAWIAN